MNPYAIFLAFLLASIGVVGLPLALNAFLGPRVAPSAAKLEPFECGAEPVQPRNVRRLSVKYYPVAIFFLLFDVETAPMEVYAAWKKARRCWIQKNNPAPARFRRQNGGRIDICLSR